MAAAPTTAAKPMLAAFNMAPLGAALVVAAAAPVEVAVVEVPPAEVVALVVAGVVATGVETDDELEEAAGVEVLPPPAATELLLDPAGVEDPPELWLEPLPTHDEELPGWMVKAADCAVAPVLSRRVKPMEVPDAMSVVHVKEVPDCWPRFSRAAAPGWLPGRMLKK